MDYGEFLSRLKNAGMDKNEFCEITGLAMSTIHGWGSTRRKRKTPSWVEPMLDLIESNKQKDIIIDGLYKQLKDK